jgi:hypothetical protein
VALAAAAAASAACGREQAAHRSESAAAVPPVEAATDDTSCRKTGRWQLCSVHDRLESAGLSPVERDSVRQPFLTMPGAAYAVGGGELQVYLYPDSLARQRDLADFDTARVQSAQPADSAAQPRPQATLITSNNLAAILLSDSETQIERVQLALTAGLPDR